MGMPEEQALESAVNAQFFTKQAFEFQGFLLLLTIPFLAMVARITFWGKRYFNFTEQLVFYLYTYGHSVIVTTPFSILVVFLFPAGFIYIGLISLPLMYLYNAYCYKRCFKMDNMAIATKTLISVFVMIGLTLAIGIILVILGIIVGLLLKGTGTI